MSGPKAEVLQSNEVVESRLKSWRDNLLGLMKERGLTQNGLAELINNRFYGESESGQFTQKNVSTWVNAGLPDRKGHVRPFPKFEIMLQIAAVLEVDLGYLIGDIECKTYEAQDAHEYTGIEESALEEVRKITHFERKYHLGESRGSNSAIMSEILKSPIFPELLDEMGRLVRLNDKRDAIKRTVVSEYGEELVNRALRYCGLTRLRMSSGRRKRSTRPFSSRPGYRLRSGRDSWRQRRRSARQSTTATTRKTAWFETRAQVAIWFRKGSGKSSS